MGGTYTLPDEPLLIKRGALERANSGQWSFIERSSTINMFVLAAQFLPKYLWEHWKPALKSRGISWQLFLKVISACEYDVVAWVEGRKPWKELIDVITKVLRKAEAGVYPLWPP